MRETLVPLVADFHEVADAYGVEDEVKAAFDRLFGFTLLILGADQEAWPAFAQFTINEAILRRDDQNRALYGIQVEAEPWLRKSCAHFDRDLFCPSARVH